MDRHPEPQARLFFIPVLKTRSFSFSKTDQSLWESAEHTRVSLLLRHRLGRRMHLEKLSVLGHCSRSTCLMWELRVPPR